MASNINIQDKFGDTMLIYAASRGKTRVVKKLLKENKIDLNVQNKNGDTALIFATRNQHKGVVKALIKRLDMDINAPNYYGQTAIGCAANNKAIMKLLLSRPDLWYNMYYK